MKRLLILGAGSAGTMMANHLVKKLDLQQWKITVVDQHKTHYYQPGFLFIPFGTYSKEDVCKPKTDFMPKQVEYIQQGIDIIKGEENTVLLEDGQQLDYDILIIATGSKIAPDEIEGLTGEGWMKDAFDFYTIEGATALAERGMKKGDRVALVLPAADQFVPTFLGVIITTQLPANPLWTKTRDTDCKHSADLQHPVYFSQYQVVIFDMFQYL